MVVRLSDRIFDVLLFSTQNICRVVLLHFQFYGMISFSSLFFFGLFKNFGRLFEPRHNHVDQRTFLFSGRAPPPSKT